MRDVIFWLSGAALAFFITAGAFLLLANLATAPSEKRLTADPPRPGPPWDSRSTRDVSPLSGRARIKASTLWSRTRVRGGW